MDQVVEPEELVAQVGEVEVVAAMGAEVEGVAVGENEPEIDLNAVHVLPEPDENDDFADVPDEFVEAPILEVRQNRVPCNLCGLYWAAGAGIVNHTRACRAVVRRNQ